jgi:hypothetical protein
MKILTRAILGAYRTVSALLLTGSVLCNFDAQANIPYSKIGVWSVAYLEVGNLNGCRAAAQFPDQTVFQMAQIQSGTDKAWIIFISNPRWNAWIGKRKELRLQLWTDWPTTRHGLILLRFALPTGAAGLSSSSGHPNGHLMRRPPGIRSTEGRLPLLDGRHLRSKRSGSSGSKPHLFGPATSKVNE